MVPGGLHGKGTITVTTTPPRLSARFGPSAFILAALLLLPAISWAQTLTVPRHANENKSFTVRWSGGDVYVHLEERVGNGAWKRVLTQANPSGSTQLSRPVGVYTFRIQDCRFVRGTPTGPVFGCSPWSTERVLHVTKPITPPASLTASVNYSTGRVTLTWPSAGSSITHYVIQQSDNGGSWRTINSTTAGTSLQTGVLSSGSYRWRIQACFGTASVCSSSYRTSSTHTLSPPSTPSFTNFSTTSETGSYTVAWNPVTRAGYYRLQEDGVFLTPNPTGTTRSRTNDVGTYTYRVSACNLFGCSSNSAARTVTVTAQSQPPVAIEYEYDAMGRLREVVVSGSVKTGYVYDKAGNRTQVTEN